MQSPLPTDSRAPASPADLSSPARAVRISVDSPAAKPAPLSAIASSGLPHRPASPAEFPLSRVSFDRGPPRRAAAAGSGSLKDRGKRRARRFLNELLLRKTAIDLRCVPVDEDDLRELFAVTSTSSFADLFDSEANFAAWESFQAAPEEEQERRLRRQSSRRRKPPADPPDPHICYRRIEKRIRALLNSKHPSILPVLAHIEGQVRSCPAGGTIAIELQEPFHRLLAHGIAQFYALQSHSETLPDGRRVTKIDRPAPSSHPTPPISLAEHLAALHRSSSQPKWHAVPA